MPRRILNDSSRGWSGWESRFNSALRMSKSSLFTTKVKNEQESNRLVLRLKQLNKSQTRTESMTNRDLKEVRDHFVNIVATGQVYKRHRFEIYDPYLKDIKQRATITMDAFKDIRRTNIKQDGGTVSSGWSKVRRNSEWQQFSGLEPIPESPREVEPNEVHEKPKSPLNAFQRRESDAHMIVQAIQPIPRRGSIASVVSNGNKDRQHSASSRFTERSNIDRLHSATSRLTDVCSERFDPFRVKEYTYRRIKRKNKTIIMSRDRTIFPGECKSTYEMRKFMEREATDLVYSFSPEGRRKTQIESLKRKAKLPVFVDRSKSMSAILRDYREYKDRQSNSVLEAV